MNKSKLSEELQSFFFWKLLGGGEYPSENTVIKCVSCKNWIPIVFWEPTTSVNWDSLSDLLMCPSCYAEFTRPEVEALEKIVTIVPRVEGSCKHEKTSSLHLNVRVCHECGSFLVYQKGTRILQYSFFLTSEMLKLFKEILGETEEE